jgi:hypothetical protein
MRSSSVVVAFAILIGPLGARATGPTAAAAPAPVAEPGAPDQKAGLSSEDAALDGGAPPPGSAADQALWKAARGVNTGVIIVRKASANLQALAKNERLLERLQEAAKGAEEARAKRLGEVRQQLEKAWRSNYEIRSRPWPVNTVRVCTQRLLLFDSAMHTATKPGGWGGHLATTRDSLKTCVERARLAIDTMSASNDALGAAIAEAQESLKQMPAPASAPVGPGAKGG